MTCSSATATGSRRWPLIIAARLSAYVLFEDERPGEFDPATAAALGLIPGPEFGRVQRGETIRGVRPEQVMGAPRPGRKLVLSGDTRPCDALRIASHGADVLVHEATFAEEERDRARANGHSTAAQAAHIARDAEVGMLALNHVSTRHPLRLLRDEARSVFANTVVPRDFDTIEIPLAERGEPELVRWDPTAAAPAEPDRRRQPPGVTRGEPGHKTAQRARSPPQDAPGPLLGSATHRRQHL